MASMEGGHCTGHKCRLDAAMLLASSQVRLSFLCFLLLPSVFSFCFSFFFLPTVKDTRQQGARAGSGQDIKIGGEGKATRAWDAERSDHARQEVTEKAGQYGSKGWALKAANMEGSHQTGHKCRLQAAMLKPFYLLPQ